MNGFDKLKEEVKDQKDPALKQTVDYLLSREDMEEKYLNEEKSLADMAKFIREKGIKHCSNGWNYITNEIVYAWAIMYYSLPNSLLKINNKSNENTTTTKKKALSKDNVVSLEKAKKKIEEKVEVEQISLFGGNDNETRKNR